jgi:class 3 adenylate cyclase
MDDLPTGTVTFLFTDIEGSTRLWEQQPQAMQAALARHDAPFRQAIETHRGYVFKTIGDGFCAVFASPKMAVRYPGSLATPERPAVTVGHPGAPVSG